MLSVAVLQSEHFNGTQSGPYNMGKLARPDQAAQMGPSWAVKMGYAFVSSGKPKFPKPIPVLVFFQAFPKLVLPKGERVLIRYSKVLIKMLIDGLISNFSITHMFFPDDTQMYSSASEKNAVAKLEDIRSGHLLE